MPIEFDFSETYLRVAFDPLIPSVQVGALSGASGLVFGGLSGIFVSQNPVLFSLASGIQWFGLGSTFCYCRSALIEARTAGTATRRQELQYSALAGSLSGAINGAFRSRSNIVPGAIMIGLLGLVGQGGYNTLINRGDFESGLQKTLKQRLAESKWTPLKALSDEQYEGMLKEKLLKIEVEISLIDDKIAALEAPQPTKAEIGAAHAGDRL